MDALLKLGSVPFDLPVLQSLFPDCRHITDKALRLVSDGKIVRLKKGLYVVNSEDGDISRELIANQLYGPSYVSMSWALRFYGLIPERVHLIQSVTTKHSRNFSNPVGNFHYQNCRSEYFPIGVTMQGSGNVRFLIASPEKALCDYINYNKVTLRFMSDVGVFLEEDLRFDMDTLGQLDLCIIQRCAEVGRKTGALFTLLKFLKNDRHI